MTGEERILRLASRGDGVTESGRHVPFAAPGDLVAEDGETRPGPHRIVPPCRHFPECGGCQLQHVDDAAFAAFLEDRIASALSAQGLDAPDFAPAHVSPPRTRRRAILHADRPGPRVRIGFHAQASHRIVDMHECHILTPALFALTQSLRDLLSALLPRRGRARISLAESDQGIDVTVAGPAPEGLEAIERATDFARAHRLARLAFDDGFGPQTFWEPEPVTITLGGVAVSLPHDGFLQATRDGEAALVAAVGEIVGDAGTIADLFAGLGTFALSLPGKVLAVEGARDAALALKAAAARAGRAIHVEHRDLFRRPLEAPDLDRFEAILLDPPRAGAREQVDRLACSSVRTIAYVSCNPSTFARDATRLVEGGYRLDRVWPVGQFRWSVHVELAARFVRE